MSVTIVFKDNFRKEVNYCLQEKRFVITGLKWALHKSNSLKEFVTQPYVSKIKSGKIRPPDTTLIDLCRKPNTT